MSIFGNKSTFAIECKKSRFLNNKLHINFQLWIEEESVGDYEDEIPLYQAIFRLKKFLQYTGNRYEVDLEDKSKNEVFDKIYNSVVCTFPNGITLDDIKSDNLDNWNPPPYENIEDRFHLELIGLSSFDGFSIILAETKNGSQRIIWRNLNALQLKEKMLESSTFENVAIQFLEWAKTVGV